MRAEILQIRYKGQHLYVGENTASVRATLAELTLCKVNSFSDETDYGLREKSSASPKTAQEDTYDK